MNFKRGMRPTANRTRLYSTPSNFELQQQSAPSQTRTLSGTSRWQLRKTPGLPTSRRNCNGLHHGPPYCQSQEFNISCGQSTHQNGPFHPLFQVNHGRKDTQLIMDRIIRLHGLPEEIVSDKGPQFASKFWRRLFELLGVDIRLSSVFHPETDGQTELTNQTLEQYLRCTLNYQQDD